MENREHQTNDTETFTIVEDYQTLALEILGQTAGLGSCTYTCHSGFSNDEGY